MQLARALGAFLVACLLTACSTRTPRATTVSPDGEYVVYFVHDSAGATTTPVTFIIVRRSSEPSPANDWRPRWTAIMEGDPADGMVLEWLDSRTLRFTVENCATFELGPDESPITLKCAHTTSGSRGR